MRFFDTGTKFRAGLLFVCCKMVLGCDDSRQGTPKFCFLSLIFGGLR